MGDRINHTGERLVIAHLDRIATALERIADNPEACERLAWHTFNHDKEAPK